MKKELTEQEIVKSLVASFKKLFSDVKFPKSVWKEMEALSPDEIRDIINENMLMALSMELEKEVSKSGNMGKQTKKAKKLDNDTRTWTIGAVVPFSNFKYVSCDDEEFRKCFALTNLRPIENRGKN